MEGRVSGKPGTLMPWRATPDCTVRQHPVQGGPLLGVRPCPTLELTPGPRQSGYGAIRRNFVHCKKWESHLFPAGVAGIEVPKTNNRLEQVFRRMRRNVRKRCGDKATGRQLTLTGEKMLLYQNLTNPTYVKAVFGEESMAVVFGRRRASLPKVHEMGRKERERLLDQGQQMLRKGQILGTPYTEEMFAQVQRQARSSLELLPHMRLPI